MNKGNIVSLLFLLIVVFLAPLLLSNFDAAKITGTYVAAYNGLPSALQASLPLLAVVLAFVVFGGRSRDK